MPPTASVRAPGATAEPPTAPSSSPTRTHSSVPPPPTESNTAPPPPAATFATDVCYFDLVHSLLLDQIKSSNSGAVLILLSLPVVANAPVFWQTCTYRGGLVAALLLHVMEHTGQTTVTAARPTANNTSDGGSGGADGNTETTSSASSASLPTSTPATAAVAPLTAHDLFRLLHHCVPAGSRGDATHNYMGAGVAPTPQRTSPWQQGRKDGPSPTASAYATALSLLLRHWRDPQAQTLSHSKAGVSEDQHEHHHGDSAAVQDDRDLQLYLRSVLRELELMIHSVHERQPQRSETADAVNTNPRKRTRAEDGELPVHPDLKRALSVDLAALVAVLQEHFSNFTYVNPFFSQSAAGKHIVHGGSCSSRGGGGGTNSVRDATTTTITTLMADIDPSASPGAPPSLLTAAKAVTEDESSGDATDEGSNDTDEEEDGEVDAVTMLQRLPAITATRWAIPAVAAAQVTGTESIINRGKSADAVRHAIVSNAHRSSSLSIPSAGAAAGAANDTGTAPTASPQNAETARVSAAIRAFDAFTAALEQRPPDANGGGGGDDGFTAAQRHRGEIRASTAAAASAGAAAAAVFSTPRKGTAAPTARPDEKVRRTHRPPSAPSAKATAAAAPAVEMLNPRTAAPQGNTRVPQRRYKFSVQEDSAIMHGVALFGQGSGAFNRIYDAYRTVWLAGRKAVHLYDHWRGALRRRAVAAVSEEVMNAEGSREDNSAKYGSAAAVEGQPLSHAGAPSVWAPQELSSDIEDSDAEDPKS